MDGRKLDINTATVDDFGSLVGIGHAKAEAILEARKKCGGFKSLSDLVKISGIGPGLLEQNMGKLTCSSPSGSSSNKTPASRRCERETRSSALNKTCELLTPTQSGDFDDQPSTSGQSSLSSDPGSNQGSNPGSKGKGEGSRPRRELGVSTRSRSADQGRANPFCIQSDSEASGSDNDRDNSDADDSAAPSGGGSSTSGESPLYEDNMDCSEYSAQSPQESERGEREESGEEEEEEEEEEGCEVRSLRSRIPVPQSALDKYWMKRKCVGEEARGYSPGKKQCCSPDSSDGELSLSTVMKNASAAATSGALRKQRIPSRSNPSPELLQWIKTFQEWSNAERLLGLDSLIEVCDPTQVRHLMAVIEPQFQRDFISLLPKELALYVLSFLEPKDLLKAAQTCRYWRILAEDNLLWREKCREESIDESLVYGGKLRRKSGASTKSPWKGLYMRQKIIEYNWRLASIRPPKVLKGHDDHVITCLEFSGTRIVSGSDDNTLKVWSAVTGKCLRTLVGHTGGVWSSQMQGHIIISGSTDRTLKVWNADTGQCMHTLYGHTSTVRCMHLYKNKVVSGSRDATLRLWDIESGQCLHVLMGHVAAVRCVQYDGRRVVSGAYDYMVKVWDPETETCLHTLQGHTNRVYSLQFDGVHIVSGSLDTSIRVWDVESGNCLHTLIGHQSLTSGMELKDNILVSGNADSTVKVWDITTGQCLQTLQGSNKHQSAVTCLQFNKRFVITSSDDGTVKIWCLRSGDFLRNLVSLDSGGSGGVVWRIRCCNTKLVCAVGSRNGTEETKLLVLDFDVDETQGSHLPLVKKVS